MWWNCNVLVFCNIHLILHWIFTIIFLMNIDWVQTVNSPPPPHPLPELYRMWCKHLTAADRCTNLSGSFHWSTTFGHKTVEHLTIFCVCKFLNIPTPGKTSPLHNVGHSAQKNGQGWLGGGGGYLQMASFLALAQSSSRRFQNFIKCFSSFATNWSCWFWNCEIMNSINLLKRNV